jgi:hypothetical protein
MQLWSETIANAYELRLEQGLVLINAVVVTWPRSRLLGQVDRRQLKRSPEMYGPPSDCKGKAKSGSTDLRKCIRPLCGEWSLLAMMSCAACSC